MPNYVNNRIEIQGPEAEVKTMFEALGTPHPYKSALILPDFKKVIPPPANMYEGNLSLSEKDRLTAQGIPNWVDWQHENWGCRDNCYNCTQEGQGIWLFQTSWCGVPVIVETISKRYPTVTIVYEYASEGMGYMLGRYVFKFGEVIKGYFPKEGSTKAHEFFFKLWPSEREEYELIHGNYFRK